MVSIPRGRATRVLIPRKTSSQTTLETLISISTCNPIHEKTPEFDYTLCISLLCMGFHYPCAEYAGYLVENVAPGSVVVIDKRRDVADIGFDVLAKFFQPLHVFPSQKSDRVIMRRF